MCKVCGVCGSTSNPELMATCSDCKENSEHLYCMLLFRLDMPEEWYCELCKPTCKENSSQNKDFFTKKNKVKFLSMDEVLRLSSEGPPRTSRSIGSSEKFLEKNHTLAKSSIIQLKSQCTTRTSRSIGSSEKFLEKNHTLAKSSIIQLKSQCTTRTSRSIGSSDNFLEKNSTLVKSSSIRLSAECTTRHSGSSGSSDKYLGKNPTAVKCSTLKLDSAIEKIIKEKSEDKLPSLHRDAVNIKAEQFEVDIPNDSGFLTSMQQNQTHVEAIKGSFTSTEVLWKGNIEILDVSSIVYDEIEAHCPGKVSQKAFDATKRLPVRIKLELFQRKTIWPKSFQFGGVSYEDIAFYLLPVGNTRPQYQSLLENITSKDLAMRRCQDGVQLLLFSSKQLPSDSQKKNGDLYLWGCFCPMKGNSSGIHAYEKCQTVNALKPPFDTTTGFSR